MSYRDAETRALLEGFAGWLETEGYAPSTVEQSRRDAARVIEDCLDRRYPPARLRFVGLRLAKYLDEIGLGGSLGDCFAWLIGDEAKDAHQREVRRGRKLEARSVDDQNWVALYRAVHARPGLAARVIEVQMVSGLRVGDVLRVRADALRAALKHHVLLLVVKGGRTRELHLQGPLRDAFQRLADALGPALGTSAPVHRAITGEASKRPYSTAYKAVARELHRAADAMELPGRAHTHRLRRTVAMQALRTTRDVRLVQQLLGHLSPASTMRYVDEERPGEVADVAGAIHDRFLPGES